MIKIAHSSWSNGLSMEEVGKTPECGRHHFLGWVQRRNEKERKLSTVLTLD